jgi:hypothetical protein
LWCTDVEYIKEWITETETAIEWQLEGNCATSFKGKEWFSNGNGCGKAAASVKGAAVTYNQGYHAIKAQDNINYITDNGKN